MTKIFNDLGLYIDNLRKSRNISREDFIDGIISTRQYQRFVNGESSLNNEKTFKLIDRLGMSFFNVHKLYVLHTNKQRPKLNNIYKEIISENLNSASEFIEELSPDDFFDEYNKLFYEVLKLILHRRKKTMPFNLVADKLKRIINYPDCMKNEVMSFIEYIVYLNISSDNLDNNDDIKILNFLYEKISNENINFDYFSKRYIPSTYAHVAKKLGSIDEYKKALVISQKGIEYCKGAETINSLAHLYIYKALSLKYLERLDESYIAAKKCFDVLDIEEKDFKTKSFTDNFERLFNMKVTEL